MSNSILNENPKFVTHPDKITSIILAIQIQGSLCTLTLPGQKKRLLTSIIEVNKNQKLLILDEVNSAEDIKSLRSTDKIKLSTYLNGVHLAFILTLTPKKHPGTDTVRYIAPLPERIYYPQRRSSPRVTAGALTFRWQVMHNKPAEYGEVLDISRGGISIRLNKENSPFQTGDILRRCHITLPNSFDMVFNLTVSSIKVGRKKLFIGGFFVNLSPQCQRNLESYIAALERETIRKRKNTLRNL